MAAGSLATFLLICLFLLFTGKQNEKRAAAAIEQRIISQETVLKMKVDSLLREYVERDTERIHGNGDIYTFIMKMGIIKQLYQHPKSASDLNDLKSRLERQLVGWALERFPSIGDFVSSLRGRGIVATADDKTAPQLINTIITLRRLGCQLPVEVIHHPDHGPGQKWIDRLKLIEMVDLIPISRLFNMTSIDYSPSSFKLFAVIASTFQEVIYMDGEAVFVRNPEIMFSDPGYIETGTVFYRDRTMGGYSPLQLVEVMDKISPGPFSELLKGSALFRRESHYQLESAVMAMDKKRHMFGLLAATRLVAQKDSTEVWKYFQPHKESFWLGMELMGEPYHFVPQRCGAVGVPSEEKGKRVICGKMAHQDGDGRLFWFLGGLAENPAQNRTTAAILTHYVQEGHYVQGLCLSGDIRVLDSADQSTLTTMVGHYDPDPLAF